MSWPVPALKIAAKHGRRNRDFSLPHFILLPGYTLSGRVVDRYLRSTPAKNPLYQQLLCQINLFFIAGFPKFDGNCSSSHECGH